MNPLWIAFLTGLTTGGISCLAVQGGLLATAVSGGVRTEAGPMPARGSRWYAVSFFLLAKLVSHAMLGFLLGLVGSGLIISPKTMGILQIVVGLYLLATAARIADIHPVFRYTVIQPPVWTYKLLRRFSKNPAWFAPMVLGFFTVLMPCGVTQAMMVIAVTAGNPVLAAGIMAAFVLGTSPVFFLLGVAVVEFLQRKVFAYLATALLIVFGILTINGGLVLRGSFLTIQNFYRAATTDFDKVAYAQGSVAGLSADGKQEVTIQVASNGYHTATTTLKAGVPVDLTLVTNKTSGCARVFTIPDYNISKVLPATGTERLEFTPAETGILTYSCSMGMYTGQFTVI